MLFALGGCAKEAFLTRPTIAPDLEWRIEEACGYQGCASPPVDILVGRYFKIRLESQSSEKPPLFLISAWFLLDPNVAIEIDPSLTRVVLSDNRVLQAKGYICSGTIFERDYKIRVPPIRSTIVLTAKGNKEIAPYANDPCIYFVFDSPPPNVHSEFKFIINGVRVNGELVNVPVITFRPVLTRY